jgi:hypothetical protein
MTTRKTPLAMIVVLVGMVVLGGRHAALANPNSNANPGVVRQGVLPDPGSRQKVRTDSQGRRITVVDFDDARIEGEVKAPDGFVLRSRDGAKVGTILELRKNFRKRIRAVGHEGLQAVPME